MATMRASQGVAVALRTDLALAYVLARNSKAGELQRRLRERFGLNLPMAAQRAENGGIAGLDSLNFIWAGPSRWLAGTSAQTGASLEAMLRKRIVGRGFGDQPDRRALCVPHRRTKRARGVWRKAFRSISIRGSSAPETRPSRWSAISTCILASRPHADLRFRRAAQLCRKLLRMAIRGVGEIWLVGSRCLTPAGKQRPARSSRASATLLDHQDAHAVGQQGVDALRNGNELPTTDVLPRVQARSSSYCATRGIWPMFAQRADFRDHRAAFGVRSPSGGGSAADIRA